MNKKNALTCITISLFVIVITFWENDWVFYPGPDPSLIWVYNWLFKNNLALSKHIIFPHGPLSIFWATLSDNIILVTITVCLLKALLVFNMYCLMQSENKYIKWITILCVAYFLCVILNFHGLILLNILLLYCNYFNSEQRAFKWIVFFLTALNIYVQASSAIIFLSLFISFVSYYLIVSKKIKPFLTDCFVFLVMVFALWFSMYGSVGGLGDYIRGMYELAKDNSTAVSCYPENDWLALVLFFAVLATIFLINRTKESLFFSSLITLALFATWKHSMARENFFHARGLWIYTLLCLVVFIMFYKKKRFINICLSIIAMFFCSLNLVNTFGQFYYPNDFLRGTYFMEFVSDFTELVKKNEAQSNKNIACQKLPAQVRKEIGNSTVDIYPLDYTIIAANKLYWQPRVVIQSYAAYTSWLDAKDAQHFNSNKSPEYLIWQPNPTHRPQRSDFSSIDDRYLLNDEPQTLVQLLKNYEYYYSDEKFIIVKKRTNSISNTSVCYKQVATTWNEWVDVPSFNGNLVRAKLNFDKTFLQRVKSFLYKDEQFWICMKLKNGAIHKYTIVPKNAVDGLWINPYLYMQNESYEVEKIMFTCSQKNILTDNLTIVWEEIQFSKPHVVEDFFHSSPICQ